MKIYKIETKHKIAFFRFSRARAVCDMLFTSESSALECLVHSISMALEFVFKQKFFFAPIPELFDDTKKIREVYKKLPTVSTVNELNDLMDSQNFRFLIACGGLKNREIYDLLISEQCEPYPQPRGGRQSIFWPTTWQIAEIETDQLIPEKIFYEGFIA